MYVERGLGSTHVCFPFSCCVFVRVTCFCSLGAHARTPRLDKARANLVQLLFIDTDIYIYTDMHIHLHIDIQRERVRFNPCVSLLTGAHPGPPRFDQLTIISYNCLRAVFFAFTFLRRAYYAHAEHKK